MNRTSIPIINYFYLLLLIAIGIFFIHSTHSTNAQSANLALSETVDCDNQWGLSDVAWIKRLNVFLVTGGLECTDGVTITDKVNDNACDINGDSDCSLIDALIIQQCNAFITNQWCVLLEPPTTPTAITASDAISQMGKGFNIGQTFDNDQHTPTFDEISPKIDAYYAKGYRHVRIPVTWTEPIDGYTLVDPNTGDLADTQRLEELTLLIDHALSYDDLFVIINMHHESDVVAQNKYWVVERVWEQVSELYADRSHRLIFEILNEPHINGADMPDAQVRNIMGLAYDKIRATTPERIIGVTGTGYAYAAKLLKTWSQPSDFDMIGSRQDPYVMATAHLYSPWTFAGNDQGDYADAWTESDITDPFDDVVNWSENTADGMPIYIGEWGVGWGSRYGNSMQCNNVRAYFEKYDVLAQERGLVTTVWDDGGWFMIWDHQTDSWNNNLVDCIGGSCDWDGTDRFGPTCN